MRTLVGAADPQPQPALAYTGASNTATSNVVFKLVINTAAGQPVEVREPYRTTAHVGEPLRELER